MLIDAEVGAEGPVAFPGIGINVNGDPTVNPELRDVATSLRREVGRPVQRESLLAAICNRLEAMLTPSEDPLIVEYRQLSMILDRDVTVTPVSGEPYVAKAVSIADDGGLIIQRHDGTVETVLAAEVTLRPV